MHILCLKASHAMGMGHLFRMLNLYHALQAMNEPAVFVLLDSEASAGKWLAERNLDYEFAVCTQNSWENAILDQYHPVCWINDRLHTDAAHAAKIKEAGIRLVTFDDLGTGASYADINVSALAEARGESPLGKRVLTGMDYLILSPEINAYRRLRQSADKLIVNLGGSDTYGMTVKVVEYLVRSGRSATVVLGPGFMHDDALREVMNDTIVIKRSLPSLMAEFAEHDIAITGGGLTAFEAAASGMPTLTIANELHEIGHCQYLQKLGCSVYAGYRNAADFNKISSIKNVAAMSKVGLEKVKLDSAEKILREALKIRE